MKDDPGGSWTIGALGILVVGKTLVYGLMYFGEDAYYELILLVDLIWMGGSATCMWIAVWYFYLDRERPQRTVILWLGAVASLFAMFVTLFELYR